MKIPIKLYHFLGSAKCAVFLIASAAFMVIAGTLLESKTGSHQFAAYVIYSNPLFKALLIGFFFNILFSALRRWPFNKRHIPFLITHLGLLMIIAGTFIKTTFGLQGNLLLLEGSGSRSVLIPDQMGLSIENKRSLNKISIPLKPNALNSKYFADGLMITTLEYSPNALGKFDSWIHDGALLLSGMQPIPAVLWNKNDPLPKAQKSTYALLADEPALVFRKLLTDHLSLRISSTASSFSIGMFPLSNVLEGVNFTGGSIRSSLSIPDGRIDNASLNVSMSYNNVKSSIAIPFCGPAALLNHSSSPWLGKAPLSIDIICKPFLAFIQDREKNIFILSCDGHGRIYPLIFKQGELKSYIAYDDGFGGYALQAELPDLSQSLSREKIERMHVDNIISELESANGIELSPPLRLFKAASGEENFAKSLIAFLDDWDKKGGWLYPEHEKPPEEIKFILQKLNWESLAEGVFRALGWTSHIFGELEPKLIQGEGLLSILQKRNWPFMKALNVSKDPFEQFSLFSQQLFAAGSELPEFFFPQGSTGYLARLFSAYLRIFGIHFSSIPLQLLPAQHLPQILETPLKPSYKDLAPEAKWEENTPRITLAISNGIKNEKISLIYDRLGTGMKWPALNGNVLLRFQPLTVQIPYHIRLHRAQRIDYPDSEQPFSFESELTITDIRGGTSQRKTVSMNQVHETWDGYRFYLSGLTQHPSGIHAIQLIVNKDPAKYWLTYPGGLILAIGIGLLFWLNPYKKKKS